MAAKPTMKQETPERKIVKKKMSKAQMQLAIIKKKQCDAKALTIVEQLLEPRIDCQWLLYNLRFINRCHLEDVIEERAIIKLCGYVLCNNVLTAVIGQQYHISTKKNKVYDVTKRKNFCSSRCYGACNYLLEQMLTSPLWLRDKEEIPNFKVLPAKEELEKSIPGDEICLRDTSLILKLDSIDNSVEFNTMCKDPNNTPFNENQKFDVNNQSNTERSLHEMNKSTEMNNVIEHANIFKEQFSKDSSGETECKEDKSIKLRASTEIHRETNNVKEDINDNTNEEAGNDVVSTHEDTTKNNENNLEQYQESEKLDNLYNTSVNKCNTTFEDRDFIQKVEKRKYKMHNPKDSVKYEMSDKFYNLAVNIEKKVREWVTEDTISLLSGEGDTKNRLLETVMQHDKYLHLCKKLNKLQLEDEKDDRVYLSKNTLKPLPHLSVLQEEGKKMELKVRAFYKGDITIEIPSSTKKGTEEDGDFAPVLPLTDSHAPKALRRRIFLDQLNRILPDLLRALASTKYSRYVYEGEMNALIKALVNTFTLSATNITFKTAEWTLVGLIIIKMLGLIDPQLKVLLSTRQASMYISMILMSYKLDSNYLDRFVMELTNNIKICSVDDTTNS